MESLHLNPDLIHFPVFRDDLGLPLPNTTARRLSSQPMKEQEGSSKVTCRNIPYGGNRPVPGNDHRTTPEAFSLEKESTMVANGLSFSLLEQAIH